MTAPNRTDGWTRRRFVAAGTVAGVLGLAGCSSGEPTTETDPLTSTATATPTETGEGTEPTADTDRPTDGEFPQMVAEVEGDRRTPVIGNPDAEVTVMAFENYLCGHCATYSLQHYPELKREYIDTGRIRYEFHDLPFDREGWEASMRAPHAARAVWADAGHDAFWEYSHALFENQSSLGPETYARLAERVGADPENAREAAANRRYQAAVQADVALAGQLGVRATPTIFVDGEQTKGYGYETIAAAIADATSGSDT